MTFENLLNTEEVYYQIVTKAGFPIPPDNFIPEYPPNQTRTDAVGETMRTIHNGNITPVKNNKKKSPRAVDEDVFTTLPRHLVIKTQAESDPEKSSLTANSFAAFETSTETELTMEIT
ncbi:hypothetical protein CEXT_53201 [Caerostris extrusa]|uniref:Uncharacterized protein n=1 Tax=Caerostris extrusa TaxID=172846 RepID=A0AAV4P4V8_CAEEX|nr:hypothetical protein CEXT_53201 [Caerostris extrusa]